MSRSPGDPHAGYPYQGLVDVGGADFRYRLGIDAANAARGAQPVAEGLDDDDLLDQFARRCGARGHTEASDEGERTNPHARRRPRRNRPKRNREPGT